MSDSILTEGDLALFSPNFGAAIVLVRPGILQASGPTTRAGRKICVEGDEQRLIVIGCPYFTGQYCIPGVGNLKIARLAANQKAHKTRSGGKSALLKGGNFAAKFEVLVPAQQPPPGPGSPIPDATPSYMGSGSFQTTNVLFKGT